MVLSVSVVSPRQQLRSRYLFFFSKCSSVKNTSSIRDQYQKTAQICQDTTVFNQKSHSNISYQINSNQIIWTAIRTQFIALYSYIYVNNWLILVFLVKKKLMASIKITKNFIRSYELYEWATSEPQNESLGSLTSWKCAELQWQSGAHIVLLIIQLDTAKYP